MNIIHFIGYSAVHPSDFLFEMTNAPGQYTLLLVSTPVQFLLEGQWQEYPAGTAMLYAPGQPICYRACRETYQNDWLRFSSDDPLVTQFPLMGVPFPVSDTAYCHNLLKLLTWETSLSSADSELTISHLLQVLFLRLRQDTIRRETSTHAPEELHLSAGYLQILYKKMFGVSCMDDVITSRIRMAREQLAYTEKPVSEIADSCGYRNVEHFCRQFRQQTGLTPGTFRRRALETLAAPFEAKKDGSREFPGSGLSSEYAAPNYHNVLSHYNVAGSDLPSDVLDAEGNILPSQVEED